MSSLDKITKISKDVMNIGTEHYIEGHVKKALMFDKTPDDPIARETFENYDAKLTASVLKRKLEWVIMKLDNI
jgi:hypothetical protein